MILQVGSFIFELMVAFDKGTILLVFGKKDLLSQLEIDPFLSLAEQHMLYVQCAYARRS